MIRLEGVLIFVETFVGGSNKRLILNENSLINKVILYFHLIWHLNFNFCFFKTNNNTICLTINNHQTNGLRSFKINSIRNINSKIKFHIFKKGKWFDFFNQKQIRHQKNREGKENWLSESLIWRIMSNLAFMKIMNNIINFQKSIPSTLWPNCL